MNKFLTVLAVLSLTACGNKADAPVSDSTVVDSTAVVDSSAVSDSSQLGHSVIFVSPDTFAPQRNPLQAAQ